MPCRVPHAELIVYSPQPQGVPVANWPERQEWPESPHLPHEEEFLRVTADSGASGTFTNTSARSTHVTSVSQLAWLPNDLGHKFIVVYGKSPSGIIPRIAP